MHAHPAHPSMCTLCAPILASSLVSESLPSSLLSLLAQLSHALRLSDTRFSAWLLFLEHRGNG